MQATSAVQRFDEISPKVQARIAGVLYLITIIVGGFDEAFVRGRVTVPGNSAATAANLKSMELLWRLGISGEMVMIISTVALMWITYLLLRPVRQDLALLFVFFGLIATAVGAAYTLQLAEALFPLGNAEYLRAFTPEQLNAMASLSLKSHVVGFGISLLLWGPFFLVTGYLIRVSTYFPRAIGVLYQIAGVAYMANSFMLIMAPRFANQMLAIAALPAFGGELSFCLWLLFKGVNMEKWNAVVGAQAARTMTYAATSPGSAL